MLERFACLGRFLQRTNGATTSSIFTFGHHASQAEQRHSAARATQQESHGLELSGLDLVQASSRTAAPQVSQQSWLLVWGWLPLLQKKLRSESVRTTVHKSSNSAFSA